MKRLSSGEQRAQPSRRPQVTAATTSSTAAGNTAASTPAKATVRPVAPIISAVRPSPARPDSTGTRMPTAPASSHSPTNSAMPSPMPMAANPATTIGSSRTLP